MSDFLETTKGSPDLLIAKSDFATDRLDLSILVGEELKIYSQQFPGKELLTKVVAVSGRSILAESSTRFAAVDNLVNNQMVVLQLRYRTEEVSVRARCRRTQGGRCSFELENKVTPLTRRRYRRIGLVTPVRLAACSINALTSRNLEKMCWMETTTVDFSSGGSLIEVPSLLSGNVFLLMNMSPDIGPFPSLILGRVSHYRQMDNLQFRVGMEFIVSEAVKNIPALAHIGKLPSVVYTYSVADRERLNHEICLINAKDDKSNK